MLIGNISEAPKVRVSPAGIPVARFTLEHRSIQLDAGLQREAYCKIVVIAAGSEFKQQMKNLALDNQVRVTGFVTRADNRQGESMLVLHAQAIELLASD